MIKKFKSLKPKGFTLVELLIIIAIIGILATVILVSLASARARARDARRKADVTEIRAGLELYKDMVGKYPIVTSLGVASSVLGGPLQQFLNPVPDDPRYTGTKNYNYISNSAGSGFAIQMYWDGGTTGDRCKVGVNDDTLIATVPDCKF